MEVSIYTSVSGQLLQGMGSTNIRNKKSADRCDQCLQLGMQSWQIILEAHKAKNVLPMNPLCNLYNTRCLHHDLSKINSV